MAIPRVQVLLVLLVVAVLPSSTSAATKFLRTAAEAPAAMAAAAPMVSPTNGLGWYRGMAREFVAGHNKVRARYGVAAARWDPKLARYARRWANAMREDCVPKHSGGKYGESVFVGRDGWNATAEDALWMWSAEEPAYDHRTGNCTAGRHFSDCGHFALMVDGDNRRLGCGRAECFHAKGVFISCNYDLLNRG